jgi:hypothetical protein
MDSYEIAEAQEPPQKKRSSGLVWNILTVLILLTIFCVVSVFFLIFIDPNSSLNPFPPPTLYPSMVPPTMTVTPRFTLIPSWTPTNITTMVATTPVATITPVSTNTPVNEATKEPTRTAAPGEYTFELQQGSPSAINGDTFHPDAGCNWAGVGGQAMSLNDEPVRGLFVQLGGSMPGVQSVDKNTMTGMAVQYGQGGFEFTLANSPVASTGVLWIQLLDQQNLPLSDRFYFDTYDDCQKNLIIIYFQQVR